MTNLNKVLSVTHSMLASMTGVVELMLEDDECKSMSDALGEVMSHYNVSFIDDKTTAWINLAQVSIGIYGTRLMANRLRVRTERAEAQRRAQEAASDPGAARNPNTPEPPSRQNVTVTQPGLPPVRMPN